MDVVPPLVEAAGKLVAPGDEVGIEGEAAGDGRDGDFLLEGDGVGEGAGEGGLFGEGHFQVVRCGLYGRN